MVTTDELDSPPLAFVILWYEPNDNSWAIWTHRYTSDEVVRYGYSRAMPLLASTVAWLSAHPGSWTLYSPAPGRVPEWN
jgi:hypothetical protein